MAIGKVRWIRRRILRTQGGLISVRRVGGVLQHIVRVHHVERAIRKWQRFARCIDDAVRVKAVFCQDRLRPVERGVKAHRRRFDTDAVHAEFSDHQRERYAIPSADFEQLLAGEWYARIQGLDVGPIPGGIDVVVAKGHPIDAVDALEISAKRIGMSNARPVQGGSPPVARNQPDVASKLRRRVARLG